MPKTVADYEDAVRRIAEADVPDDATSRAAVRAALAGADAPQVTTEVADGIADALVTEDRVIEAIEATGELPSEAELDSITSVSDDYDMADRVEAVEDAVSDRVATVEEVEAAVRERQEQKGAEPTFREDVEGAVDSVAETQEFVGESPDEVAAEQAREVGAPSQRDYERARTQLATGDDSVSPADVLGEEEATSLQGVGSTTANKDATVIHDESGDPVALTGAPTQEAGERMAEELGSEYVSITEVNESIGLDQSEGRATLTFRGEPVGEVEVE